MFKFGPWPTVQAKNQSCLTHESSVWTFKFIICSPCIWWQRDKLPVRIPPSSAAEMDLFPGIGLTCSSNKLTFKNRLASHLILSLCCCCCCVFLSSPFPVTHIQTQRHRRRRKLFSSASNRDNFEQPIYPKVLKCKISWDRHKLYLVEIWSGTYSADEGWRD